jgi:flagellar biogenesis protein FliO
MKNIGIIVTLMLTSSVVLAETPAEKGDTEQDLKALLRRLVPEEAEEQEKAIAPKTPAKKSNEQAEGEKSEKSITKPALTATSAQQLGSNVIPFAFGLLLAFGLFTYGNRRKQSGERPIKRIAVESLGAKQNLMLVEALGEYLLVATGGREPVLLAQLDTEQAKQRLAILDSKKQTNEKPAVPWIQTAKQFIKKMTPNRTPTFEDILDDAPINIEAMASKTQTNTPSPAKLALAQASFRAMQNEEAPKKRSLNERLAEIAAEEGPSLTSESKEDRADAIRRRLASL